MEIFDLKWWIYGGVVVVWWSGGCMMEWWLYGGCMMVVNILDVFI